MERNKVIFGHNSNYIEFNSPQTKVNYRKKWKKKKYQLTSAPSPFAQFIF